MKNQTAMDETKRCFSICFSPLKSLIPYLSFGQSFFPLALFSGVIGYRCLPLCPFLDTLPVVWPWPVLITRQAVCSMKALIFSHPADLTPMTSSPSRWLFFCACLCAVELPLLQSFGRRLSLIPHSSSVSLFPCLSDCFPPHSTRHPSTLP